ncbi:hypothetical protein HYPSUDRAFT_86247 [Hypholoma sublateritium FD-334 SS-4]|uniref:Uncharacterized protein n=1 Tax=Hypholoma sublateritium (strain FD-334 SS-4) TaxID=945553 RepID=A0A0D2LAQ3_HYPSF|nr:hypothetical protein HYPSUDRAFT_86247 [Hypholoma sublateritium FD-334 SS-4]
MDAPTLVDAPPPRRRAAKTARAILAAQLSDSESDAKSAESDGGGAGPSARRGRVQETQETKGRRRAATVVGGAPSRGAPALAAAASTGSIPGATIAVAPPVRPRPRPRPVARRPTPPPLAPLVVPPPPDDLGELSPLTPVSSASGGLSARGAPSAPPSPVRAKRSEPARSPAKKAAVAAWRAAALGSYVWVLVEPRTWRVYDEEAEEAEREALWWPGQIASALNTDVPLRVTLFGLADTAVSIAAPSAANVLSRDHDYLPRFLVPTFVPAAPFPAASLSKSKKRHAERDALGDKWHAAVRAMRTHDAAAHSRADVDSDDSDYPGPTANLFEFLTAPSSSLQSISAPGKLSAAKGRGKPSVAGKGKRKRMTASDDSADDEEGVYVSKKKEKKGEEWWDEVDEDLKLPGELILGRTSQAVDVDHWPGKLIAYIPPTKPRTLGKYSVLWLDGTQSLVPRLWFYSTDQDEFALCKLGEFDSAVVEVQNDNADDEPHPAPELFARHPSPVPLDPPPPSAQFAELPLRAQFAYTKSVLAAVLNDAYAPVREKQARYMRGGKHRQSLVDDASMRGKMDPRDVSDLLVCVREWCLRDGGRAGAPRGGGDRASGGRGARADANGEESDGEGEERALVAGPSCDDMNASGAMRAPSPSLTAGFPSSPQMPPSSYPATLAREASVISIASDAGAEIERIDIPSSPAAMSIATEAGVVTVADDAIDILDLTAGEDDSGPLQPSARPRQRGSSAFESLSDLDKVDYCLNILLPEAVRQVLLWRNGSRTSVALLPPADEEALYEEGRGLLAETDWVNDVVRYRKMMQAILPKGKQSQAAAAAAGSRREAVGRTGRLRRNIVMPNYQE